MGKTKYDKFMESAKRDGSLEYSTTQIDYDGYGYGRHYAGMVHVYGFDGEEEFDYIVTQARGKEIIRRLKNGTWWSIPEDIRDNYTTNGYNTRIGIDRGTSSTHREDSRQPCSSMVSRREGRTRCPSKNEK